MSQVVTHYYNHIQGPPPTLFEDYILDGWRLGDSAQIYQGMDNYASLPLYRVSFAEPTIGLIKTVKASGGDFTTLQAAYNWFTTNGRSTHSAIEIDAGYDPGVLNISGDGGPNTYQSGSDTYWLVIRTANYSNLPRHVRVGPSDKTEMPQITRPSYGYGLWFGSNSKRIRVVGISVETDSSSSLTGGASKTQLGADHIIWDRCLFRGGYPTRGTVRGVWPQGTYMGIIDCYIDQVYLSGADSQAILLGDGAGPYTIVNNYLNAAGMSIMSGGYDSSGAEYIPQDITFTRNYCSKLTSFPDSVKNHFELKTAVRVLCENNIFENMWFSAQETIFNIKSVNQGGGVGEWSKTTDVTIRKNRVINFHSGISLSAHPEGIVAEELSRVSVHDNEFLYGGYDNPLFVDVGDSTIFQAALMGNLKDITFFNNSFDGDFTHQVMHEDSENDKVNFFVQDNIFDDAPIGFQNAANLGTMCTNWDVSGNIFAPDGYGNDYLPDDNCIDAYPPQVNCPDAGITESADVTEITSGDWSLDPWES